MDPFNAIESLLSFPAKNRNLNVVVVKENIEFPVVDKENAYVTDTVKVLRSKKRHL